MSPTTADRPGRPGSQPASREATPAAGAPGRGPRRLRSTDALALLLAAAALALPAHALATRARAASRRREDSAANPGVPISREHHCSLR